MKNNKNLIIDKLFDLYVIQVERYLIQYVAQKYSFKDSNKINPKTGKKDQKLSTWQMEQHLEGKATVGIMGGTFWTKFLTFDIDYSDPKLAKWNTLKICNTLNELGIDRYYISTSGNRGYHIDIFVKDLIDISIAMKFHEHVLELSDLSQGGDVEFRPYERVGVKIPLGIQKKTGNYCGFCEVENGLSVMNKVESEEYLLHIKKIKRQQILDLLEEKNEQVFSFKKNEIL